MGKIILGLFMLTALFAVVQCDKKCDFFGREFMIPDTHECATYFESRMQGYRWPFPTFPWGRWRNILSTLLPLLPTRRPWPRPTPPADDSDEDDWPWECPDEGVKEIPHPDSCEKFILCINGLEIVRSCAEDFHFSRELLTCVPEDESDCEEAEREWTCPEDEDSISFIPNTEDCSKYFICFGGNEFPMSCPEGLHWSIEEETCMDPEDAECEFDDDTEECPDEGFKQISHPDSCKKFIVCVNGDEVATLNCPPGLHFSREERICMDPDKAGCDNGELSCPDEDDLDNLVFLPNPDDCSKYFLCFGGEKIPLSCGGGLHWSVEEESCMDPDDAECEFDDDTEECPETGVKSISHPDNCEKYVLCVNGQEFERHCPPGLHFSREVRNCVSPDIAECEANLFVCPDEDTDELVFLPNIENCSKYYLCVSGKKIALSCGPGLHWSVNHDMCLPEDIAECEFGDGIEECPNEGILNIAHPNSCEKFILCVNGVEFNRNCAAGLHFSREFRICVPPELAGCNYSSTEEEYGCPDQEIAFVPSRNNCEGFYLCFNGDRFPFFCSNGNHWNRQRQQCMIPEEAGCK